jgi:uncharacterized protein (DUF1330 family)
MSNWKDRFNPPGLVEVTKVPDGTIQLQHNKQDNVWQLSIKHPGGFQIIDVTPFVVSYQKHARSYEIDMGEYVIAAYSGWVNAAMQTHGKQFLMRSNSLKLPRLEGTPEHVDEIEFPNEVPTDPKAIKAELEQMAAAGSAHAERILQILGKI